MPSKTIDQLIINSPYEEPREYWKRDPESKLFSRVPGRRPAGYIRATESSKAIDDPGIFIELPLPNKIRPRVKSWREADYPGVPGITKRLLDHWRDPEQRENRRLFFCQLEAIETLIWLAEAPPSERAGISIPSDGGNFPRLCSKMATGSGKTIVMAMLIAWQILNKVTYAQDKRFSKNAFVVAPGLTVKNRLQVLEPSNEKNYYAEFSLIPSGLHDLLRQGKVKIVNWHKLDWESEERIAKRKTVDKRGALSDEAYVREVLEDMAATQNMVVINDEAHHAWRRDPKSTLKGVAKEELEEATKWIGGLDRIHRARGILSCFDLTATPFAPTGKRWENQNAPTPPVMITVANLTHTAARVGYSLSHKKIPIEKLGEPDGILHIDSKVLGDAEAQEEAPEIESPGAAEEDSEDQAEAPLKKLTKQERAEQLRKTVDTVGQVGQPGEKIHAVISVGMLSEGWDAKTVTHIMGLRAFTSQLLCEQVVGRG